MISLKNLKIVIVLFLCQFIPTLVSSQLSSFDIGLGASENQDTQYDQDYDYEFEESSLIFHFTIGAQINIAPKFTLTPKAAYSWCTQSFTKSQTSFGTGTINDMTFIRKNKTISYFRSGVALSYWLINRGQGFLLEGELQGLFIQLYRRWMAI